MQERDLLECEETDPQRQDDFLKGDRKIQCGVDIFDKEIAVFEISQ